MFAFVFELLCLFMQLITYACNLMTHTAGKTVGTNGAAVSGVVGAAVVAGG